MNFLSHTLALVFLTFSHSYPMPPPSTNPTGREEALYRLSQADGAFSVELFNHELTYRYRLKFHGSSSFEEGGHITFSTWLDDAKGTDARGDRSIKLWYAETTEERPSFQFLIEGERTELSGRNPHYWFRSSDRTGRVTEVGVIYYPSGHVFIIGVRQYFNLLPVPAELPQLRFVKYRKKVSQPTTEPGKGESESSPTAQSAEETSTTQILSFEQIVGELQTLSNRPQADPVFERNNEIADAVTQLANAFAEAKLTRAEAEALALKANEAESLTGLEVLELIRRAFIELRGCSALLDQPFV